jgi:toxin CptA
MAERLGLRLGSSRILTGILGGAHILAAGALWVAPAFPAWALAGSLVLAAHLGFALRRHAWRSDPRALVELELLEDGSAAARSRAGEWKTYRIAGSSFVSAQLTVLNLSPDHGRGRRAALITADNVDPDGFRRLRVWLRWRCGGGGAPEQL